MIEKLKKRHSQYALGTNLPLSNDQVDSLIRETVRLSPTPFNSQSSRIVVLFGEESHKFWGMVKEILRDMVSPEGFVSTEARVDGFAAGVGTILFYEDQDVIAGLKEQYSAYANDFPVWSEQASGMAQLAVWTALADAEIGASLQHYNPLVDAKVAAEWNLPASWKLRAQMPFGSNEAKLSAKPVIDDEIRFRRFG